MHSLERFQKVTLLKKCRLILSPFMVTLKKAIQNGFAQTNMDESEPHIALANIQQRLEIMCGGKLTVMPREGGGTVVKVILPETT